jgi:hypothetical protein
MLQTPPPPSGMTDHTLTTTDGQEIGVQFPVWADSFSPMQPKPLCDPQQQLCGHNEAPVQWYHKSPSKAATVLRWPLTSTEYQVLKGMLYHHLPKHPHGMVLNSISTVSPHYTCVL